MNKLKFDEPLFSSSMPPISSNEIENDDETLHTVFQNLTEGKLEEITKRYRLEGGDKGQVFPIVLFSGTFDKRSDDGLLKHSGLVAMDIDDLKNVEEISESIEKDYFTALSYRTPSGNGLRVVFRVDIESENHKYFYNQISQYLQEKYQITADPACKNVSRASFICHDSDTYYNPSSKVFKNNTQFTSAGASNETKIGYCLEKIIEQEVDITDGYERWLNIGFGLVQELGEDGRDYFHAVSKYYSGYKTRACDKQYDDCLRSSGEGVTIASFFHYCKEAGIEYKSQAQPKSNIVTVSNLLSPKERFRRGRLQGPLLKLFGEFWYSGQLSILFGKTGLGKSVLAMQIADTLSKGQDLLGLKNQSKPQNVLFIDFEMTDRQFLNRYTDSINASEYSFADCLRFGIINYEDYLTERENNKGLLLNRWLFNKFELLIRQQKSNVLIVDNITYLSENSTQDPQTAMEIMKVLKSIKEKYSISILVIGHPPKHASYKVMTVYDLGGSANLSTFSDSIFVIAKSKFGADYRYLKQVKSRDGKMMYEDDNVMVVVLAKDDNMLRFRFDSFTTEKDNIIEPMDKNERGSKISDLHYEGLTPREMANQLGVSEKTIRRDLSELELKPNKK